MVTSWRATSVPVIHLLLKARAWRLQQFANANASIFCFCEGVIHDCKNDPRSVYSYTVRRVQRGKTANEGFAKTGARVNEPGSSICF
jgi:hypothetical protein